MPDRRARGTARRRGLDHAADIFRQPRHVEGTMFHADIHVVGPGTSIDAPLRVGQHMATVRTVIVDCLILLQ